MSRRVWIRRTYEPPSPVDGYRVLVDRLWPRGISTSNLRIDAWARHLAPTDETASDVRGAAQRST